MDERVLLGQACIDEGAAWLAQANPRFAQALSETGQLPTRLRPDGFEALLDAIIGQQISVAAAASIRGRLADAGCLSPQSINKLSDEELRALGLSRPKVRYIRALIDYDIDYNALRDLPSVEVVAELVKIKGIGQWTAEIYAMFSLGRADVFASGDLALQESARVLFDLDKRPTDKEIAKMAEAWSPWRGVAARLLWAYYRVIKNREGI